MPNNNEQSRLTYEVRRIVDAFRDIEPAERITLAGLIASEKATDDTAYALVTFALRGCAEMATVTEESADTGVLVVDEWVSLIALLLGSAEDMQRLASPTD